MRCSFTIEHDGRSYSRELQWFSLEYTIEFANTIAEFLSGEELSYQSWRMCRKEVRQTAEIFFLKSRFESNISPRFRAESVGQSAKLCK